MERLIDNPIPIPFGFGGEEWFEDTAYQLLRIESVSRILNLDQYSIRVPRRFERSSRGRSVSVRIASMPLMTRLIKTCCNCMGSCSHQG